jgi:Domain of unknown function (DUF4167)
MQHFSELEPAAALLRPNAKVKTHAMSRTSQPTRRNEPTRSARPQAGNVQNDRRNYERYLALARTEALAGDRIAAENYFQHAEHYFRSMGENSKQGNDPKCRTRGFRFDSQLADRTIQALDADELERGIGRQRCADQLGTILSFSR